MYIVVFLKIYRYLASMNCYWQKIHKLMSLNTHFSSWTTQLYAKLKLCPLKLSCFATV